MLLWEPKVKYGIVIRVAVPMLVFLLSSYFLQDSPFTHSLLLGPPLVQEGMKNPDFNHSHKGSGKFLRKEM